MLSAWLAALKIILVRDFKIKVVSIIVWYFYYSKMLGGVCVKD